MCLEHARSIRSRRADNSSWPGHYAQPGGRIYVSNRSPCCPTFALAKPGGVHIRTSVRQRGRLSSPALVGLKSDLDGLGPCSKKGAVLRRPRSLDRNPPRRRVSLPIERKRFSRLAGLGAARRGGAFLRPPPGWRRRGNDLLDLAVLLGLKDVFHLRFDDRQLRRPSLPDQPARTGSRPGIGDSRNLDRSGGSFSGIRDSSSAARALITMKSAQVPQWNRLYLVLWRSTWRVKGSPLQVPLKSDSPSFQSDLMLVGLCPLYSTW